MSLIFVVRHKLKAQQKVEEAAHEVPFTVGSSWSSSSSSCSDQGQVFHCKLRHQGCGSAQRQVFHRKLRNQVAVLPRMNRCGSFPLLSAPYYLFSIWTNLKWSENIPWAPTWSWGEWIWLTGPSKRHRNSTQGLISVPSGFLTRSEIRKTRWPFAP